MEPGSVQVLRSTQKQDSGTPDAGEWFSKPLPPASSCGWTWGKRSELAVRNSWTEAAEHSLVKCSAQWHFSFGLKNLGMQYLMCCEMIGEAPCISSQSALGLVEKQKKKSQKVSSNRAAEEMPSAVGRDQSLRSTGDKKVDSSNPVRLRLVS